MQHVCDFRTVTYMCACVQQSNYVLLFLFVLFRAYPSASRTTLEILWAAHGFFVLLCRAAPILHRPDCSSKFLGRARFDRARMFCSLVSFRPFLRHQDSSTIFYICFLFSRGVHFLTSRLFFELLWVEFRYFAFLWSRAGVPSPHRIAFFGIPIDP